MPSEYEWGTYVDKLSRGNHGSGSQLFRVAWIADYPAMDAFLYPLFQSDQSRTGSYTFYSNKGVDDLLQKARATTDAQQRQNLYAQAEKLILTDMPASRCTRTATSVRSASGCTASRSTPWASRRCVRSGWSEASTARLCIVE